MGELSTDSCLFCEIVAGRVAASIVAEDEMTMAFVDLRQFHPGHTLVIPRRHIRDVRELDDHTGAALMAMVVRITKAVSAAFPNAGLSLWHSIGEAAFQEVPHLHIHVHPRLRNDEILQIYQELPPTTDKRTRDEYAVRLRQHLQSLAIQNHVFFDGMTYTVPNDLQLLFLPGETAPRDFRDDNLGPMLIRPNQSMPFDLFDQFDELRILNKVKIFNRLKAP